MPQKPATPFTNFDPIGKSSTVAPKSAFDAPIEDVSPPGFEGTVKGMKKHSEISNPWALSWWMKGQGMHGH